MRQLRALVAAAFVSTVGGLDVRPRGDDAPQLGSLLAEEAELIAKADVESWLPGFPTNDVQRAQARRLLHRVGELPKIPSAEVAGLAYQNLYMRFVNPWHRVEGYVPGMRVRVVDGVIFYKPEPPELLIGSAKGDFVGTSKYMEWENAAAHSLTLLSLAVANFPALPAVDFTFQFGDLCRDADGGLTRAERFGFSANPGHDESLMYAADAPPFSGSWFRGRGQSPPRLPPVFSWNARPECNVVNTPSYDWLYFNQNFTEGSFWRFDSYPQVPFQKREAKLFWRGAVISWDGSRARALRTALLHPKLLDVKVPSATTSGETATDEICDTYLKDLAAFGSPGGLEDCNRAGARHIFGDRLVPPQEQQHFKYILDMDGGGSTWRVKNVLLSGAVLFRVVHERNGSSQFFFGDLKPMEHFIPVSFERLEEDLPAKVRWARAHEQECRKIAERARLFAKEHLRTEDATWHLHAALAAYAHEAQTYTPQAPGPTDTELAPLCCEDMRAGLVSPALADQCRLTPAAKRRCAAPGRTSWLYGPSTWILQNQASAQERRAPPPTTTTPPPATSTTSPFAWTTTVLPWVTTPAPGWLRGAR